MKFKLTHVHPSSKDVKIVEKHVDRPVHIHKDVIKYVDREVEKLVYVNQEVEKLVYVDREVPVEKIVKEIVKEVVFVDKPYPVEKIKEVFKDRPVEVIIEKLVLKTPNYIWVALALETVLLVFKLIK